MASPPPGTILVIDDEPSIVRGLARLLQRDGYSVATAGNGRQALAQLQAQRFAMILSDLRMPELDGPAFYARLQQQYPALCQRVIFLTGDVDAADMRRFLAQCGQPWLAKPCRPAALRRAIQQVLGVAPPAPPAQAERAYHAQSEQLSRKSQALRQQSQVLSGAVQTLCARSAQLQYQGAILRGKFQAYSGRWYPKTRWAMLD